MSARISGQTAFGLSCSVGEVIICLIRSVETPALLISEIIRPRVLTGQTSIELYDINAMYSPGSIIPFVQKNAPKTTTNMTCKPESISALLQNRLMTRARCSQSEV